VLLGEHRTNETHGRRPVGPWIATVVPGGFVLFDAIDNTLYVDFEPAAVLEREMVRVGSRGVDLAWMILLDSFFDDLAERFELPPLSGCMDRGDVVATTSR
jgi:hypothetical protein